ncbi:MAG TPA: hypothetical protein VMV18_13560 [bacterium]|nr:hypothetical protein [bacterium]
MSALAPLLFSIVLTTSGAAAPSGGVPELVPPPATPVPEPSPSPSPSPEPEPAPTAEPTGAASRAVELFSLLHGSLLEDFRVESPDHAPADVERARTILSVRADVTSSHSGAVLDARASWLGHPPTGEARLTAPHTPLRLDADAVFLEARARTGLGRLRVRAGVQTIRWGSGLLFNPTSVVNPPDLDDPLRFGAPLGNAMLRAEWLSPVHVDAVLVPWFRPPLLPEVDDRRALLASGVAAAESIARDPSWSIAVDSRAPDPPRTVGEMAGALRVSTRIPVVDVDASVMGYTGRMAVPQLASADLTADFAAHALSGTATLAWPRQSVAGADLAGQIPLGSWGDLGAWAEGAWVMPEPMRQDLTVNGIPGTTRILTEPYARAAAGIDHTFAGESYLALEYVRGFPDEVGAPAQREYALAIFDRPLFASRAHVRVVALSSLSDASALLSPELSVTADAVTLSLAAWAGIGRRENRLGYDRVGPPVGVARASLSF